MSSNDEFRDVFAGLRDILRDQVEPLVVIEDEDDEFTLIGPEPDSKGKDLWVASVQIEKNYVSFHLMPVYVFPELVDDVDDDLLARMQGKSCFNFTKVDPELFEKLAALVERGVDRYREAGMLG